MANTIKLKTGSGSDPSASDLIVGEIAIRTDSGKLFTKKDNGSVAEISGGGGIDDGDKGDITISNGGDTFTIDNGVVTSAKIANGTIVDADISGSAAIAGSKLQAAGLVNAGSMSAANFNKLAGIEANATADMTGTEILSTISGENIILGEIASTGNSTFAGNVTISSSDGGSAAAPELDLYRISASPADADYLGQIKFSGEDAADNKQVYAKITGKAGDVTNTTEDGILEFMLVKAGSNNIAARFTSTDLKLINGTGLEVAGDIEASSDINIDNINKSLKVGDISNDNYADLRQISASSYKGFSFQHSNASVLANLQGTTNQYLVLGDNDSNNSGTLFGISIDQGGSISTRLTLSASGNLDVQNNITLGGTVDGVDIAARDTLFGGLTSSSGVLTNGVTATTQSAGNNTTRVATTAFVTTAISNLINGAPSALDTLNELAAAMNDDAAFSATVTNSLATKMPLAGGEFTGNVISHNITPDTDSTRFLGSNGTRFSKVFADVYEGSGANLTNLPSQTDNNFTDADHSKLDGIESGATADQTASEILTLIKTVDGAGSGLDADTLDGLSSASFLRADASDTTIGNLTLSNTQPQLFFTDTNNNSDYRLQNANGSFTIRDETNSANRLRINSSGVVEVFQQLDAEGGLNVTGNISVSGTVDGRDLATDGSKLDGIESGATADQSNSEIKTAYEANSNTNAFTDALLSKLNGIAASATNVTNNNQLTNGAGYITATLTNEQVQDIVGGMVSSNTESGITVTYQDGDGTLDFAVASQTDNNFTNADHSKLDGIEAGATADQSASEILTLIKTVDGAGSGLDADTLDGISSASFLRSDANDSILGTLTVGDGTGQHELHLKKADNNTADHLIFFNGTTRVGEIGVQDTTWLRINQVTNKNIYTPRYIRADNGFFVDGTSKGINGSGNFIGGTIAGASDYSTLLRSDTADTASGDITFSGGAGAVSIAANSDIRIANSSSWTGDSAGKIQHFSNWLYLSTGSNGIVIRGNSGVSDRWYFRSNGHFEPAADSAYDIGANATRVRNGYFDTLYGSGANLTALNASNISSGTISAARVPTLNQNTTGSSGSCTGNSATATKLATARTIAGVSFDGSANISLNNNAITNGAGYLTSVGTSNIADDAITAAKIADGAIGAAAIGDDAVGSAELADNAVANSRIQNNAVSTAKIADGAVTNAKINSMAASKLTGALPAIDGSNLTGISAGATGGGSDEIFYENGQTVTTNYTITNGKNAMSAGPITINSGVTVTVGSGENLIIV